MARNDKSDDLVSGKEENELVLTTVLPKPTMPNQDTPTTPLQPAVILLLDAPCCSTQFMRPSQTLIES